MTDKYAKFAAEAKPPGYIRIRFGEIRPDDLVWSVYEDEFKRGDDPGWLSPVPRAENCTYAIRYTGRHKEAYFDPQKEKPESIEKAPVEDGQRLLF